jgi:hypothetical protein
MRRLALRAGLATLVLVACPGAALAGTRTIDFDDATAPCCFIQTGPLTDRYAGLGVTFSGPQPGGGGAILNQSGGFGVSGHSAPNFLAFNTGVSYGSGKPAGGPETIAFATPIHFASIKAGQGSGGTVTLTAFDGSTPVSSSFRTSAPALAQLEVTASRITSLRLEFTGTAVVWDDLSWDTSPVSRDDAVSTAANTSVTLPPAGVLGNDSDADGDPLAAELRRAPANGLVALRADGGFTYTPRAGFSGTDTFQYRARDGRGPGNDATVAITVQPPPPPPPAPPPPPEDVPATVRNSWLAFKKFTRVRRLSLRKLPDNARVTVRCKTKQRRLQKRSCPFKRKSYKAKRSTLNLAKPFRKRKRRLPVRTRITITISAPAHVTKRVTFTVRKRKLPSVKTRCLPRGAKARRCR